MLRDSHMQQGRRPAVQVDQGDYIECRRGDVGKDGDIASAPVPLAGVFAGVRTLVGVIALQHCMRGVIGAGASHQVKAHVLRRAVQDAHGLQDVRLEERYTAQPMLQERGGKQHTSAGDGRMAPAGIRVAVVVEALPGPWAMTFWTSK
jgi:hypothetical protein